MIIVEGPDGGGKTTLVRALKDRLGWPVAPRLVTSSGQLEQGQKVRDYVDMVLSGLNEMVILDRFWLISALIYGPVLGTVGVNELVKDQEFLIAKLKRFYNPHPAIHRPLIIYCLPAYSAAITNAQADAESWRYIRSAENYRPIYWAYHAKAAHDVAHHNSLIWDYIRQPLQEIVDFVRDFCYDSIR